TATNNSRAVVAQQNQVNYIRNSVKATVDAYTACSVSANIQFCRGRCMPAARSRWHTPRRPVGISGISRFPVEHG
ncbi:UPF0182 family protein, partial [Streptomyces sp. NPDC088357]|uniref:UPF0182 family protein n=1 Tax=Streptomyces sp. NPDC088357 TaxID=3154655 RepID=UPI00342B44B9